MFFRLLWIVLGCCRLRQAVWVVAVFEDVYVASRCVALFQVIFELFYVVLGCFSAFDLFRLL